MPSITDTAVNQPGTPIHDMQVRLTLDDDFVIHDIEAVTEASPFAICPQATANYKRLIGQRIAPGWRALLRRELGGAEGCTHITEMLMAMGTVAFQTIIPFRKPSEADAGKRDRLLNSCHAFAAEGPVMKELWQTIGRAEKRARLPSERHSHCHSPGILPPCLLISRGKSASIS